METTTNENAVWAYSNTGTLAHWFSTLDYRTGRLVAACRGNITREADARLHIADDISGRLCKSCETRWNAHCVRVEASTVSVTPTGEPTGTAPEQPATDALATQPTSPKRPAYKTIIKAETTWVLQSRKDSTGTWSYVSDHGSEEAATLRAQAFLIDGSRRQFRVVEHRTEVKATGPIEPPKADKPQPKGPRYVVEPVRLGFAVVDTSTGKPEARMGSRYAANDMASRLNAEKPAG